MDYLVTSTWVAIGLIVASILVSGPLVPEIDFATKPVESTEIAKASDASVSIESEPIGEFRVAQGRFGGGPFLYTPEVTVWVEAVRGDPILIYEVAVRGLGFNAAELVFLNASDAGRNIIIEMDRPAIDQDAITEQTYEAAVSIRLRAQEETRVLYSNNVTVVIEDSNEK